MARPTKKNIEYFPHSVSHGKTLFILKSRWGNDGYAFWFQLLELIGSQDGLFYDCNNPPDWQFLLAKTLVDEVTANDILQCLCDLGAIDAELWGKRIVYSQNFVDNVADAFSRRKEFLPTKTGVIAYINSLKIEFLHETIGKGKGKGKGKEESPPIPPFEKEAVIPYAEIINYLNAKANRKYRITDGVRKLIRSRWDEGHDLSSFMSAIDNQVAAWLNDPKMSMYLRPDTLFRQSKFDGYVNNVQQAKGDVLDEAFNGMGQAARGSHVQNMEAFELAGDAWEVYDES